MNDRTDQRCITFLSAICLLMIWPVIGLIPSMVSADTVVMKTGETFTSPKVWEENGKIRFNMHGLIVNVDKSEVSKIIKHNSDMHPQRQARSSAPADLSAIPSDPTAKPGGTRGRVPEPTAEKSRTENVRRRDDAIHSPTAPVVSGIGLDGISWQQKPSDLSGLIKMNTEQLYGGIDQYYREDEPLYLGSATLDGRVYGFWRDRLYMITMWAEGPPAYRRLRKAVFERYGRGRQNSDGLERYVWSDPTTDRMLEFDPQRNTGLFWMRSRVLDEKIKAIYSD